MVKWIIQSNLINAKTLAKFQASFQALDIAYEEVQVVPFSNTLPTFAAAEVNIFYGATTLMLNAYNSPYKKGVFYHPDTFNSACYLKHWGNHMLNSDGITLPFRTFMDTCLAKQPSWFIRPNGDDKSFAGTLMTQQEARSFYSKIQQIDNPNINPDTLVFVAPPKSITKEWRTFIVDRRVVDASRYVLNGELAVARHDLPKEMIGFAEERARDFSPHDVFAMDIAQTEAGYKIIECNCFNGTGFYEHHIKTIVKAVTDWASKA